MTYFFFSPWLRRYESERNKEGSSAAAEDQNKMEQLKLELEEEKAQKKGRQKLIASILIAGFPIGLVLWWLPTQKAIAFSFAILLLLGVLSSRKNY